MTTPVPAQPERDLSAVDWQRLEEAHRRLREAVEAYEPFLARQLGPGEEAAVHDHQQVARAQGEVEVAERELWRLREELLGWSRPSWAPSATLVADWFSDEDSVYDTLTATPER